MSLPAVARDDATAEFFEGTAAGVYLIRRCEHGHASKPQAIQCSVCASRDLRWDPASGRARLMSWTVVPGRPGGADGPVPEPAVVAIAELEEGPWMWAALVGCDPGGLRDGMELRIDFERPPGSEAIPVLVVAGA